MAAHLYWRIYSENTADNDRFYLSEIEMRATVGGADQCTGGTANAFSQNTPAANAFDNDDATVWQSAYGTGTGWISYQFASAVDVLELSIRSSIGDYAPVNFRLEYSDDGSSWTTLVRYINVSWATNQTKIFGVATTTTTFPDLFPGTSKQLIYDSKVNFPSGGEGSLYVLNNAPSWANINSTTGVITINPSIEETISGVSVSVTKHDGITTTNTFTLQSLPFFGKHRYWRVRLAQSPHSFVHRCYEIEFRADYGGADQTSGGTAITNSYNAANPQENAFDNNTSTYWDWNGTFYSGIYIGYHFASAVEVKEFTYRSTSAYYPQAFYLDYSDDGINWEFVVYYSGLSWTFTETKTFGAVPRFKSDIVDHEIKNGITYLYSVASLVEQTGGDILSYTLYNAPTWMSITAAGILTGVPTSDELNENIYVDVEFTGETITSNLFAVTNGDKVLSDTWRYLITSAPHAFHSYVKQLEMRERHGGVDKCQEAEGVYSASSDVAGLNGLRAFDDDPITYWNNDVSPVGSWLKFVFAEKTNITEWAVITDDTYYASGFDFQCTLDGGYTFMDIFVVTGEPGSNAERLYQVAEPIIPPQVVLIGCQGLA